MGTGSIGGNIGLYIFGGRDLIGWIKIILIAYAGISIFKPRISIKSWQLILVGFGILGLAFRALYISLSNRKAAEMPEKTYSDSYIQHMPPEVLTPHIKESSIINPMTNTEPQVTPTMEVQPYSQNQIKSDYHPNTDDLLSSYISTSNVPTGDFTKINVPKTN